MAIYFFALRTSASSRSILCFEIALEKLNIKYQFEDYREMSMQVKELQEQVVSMHNAFAKIFGKTTVIHLMGIRNHLEATKYGIAVHVNNKFPYQKSGEIWT